MEQAESVRGRAKYYRNSGVADAMNTAEYAIVRHCEITKLDENEEK